MRKGVFALSYWALVAENRRFPTVLFFIYFDIDAVALGETSYALPELNSWLANKNVVNMSSVEHPNIIFESAERTQR